MTKFSIFSTLVAASLTGGCIAGGDSRDLIGLRLDKNLVDVPRIAGSFVRGANEGAGFTCKVVIPEKRPARPVGADEKLLGIPAALAAPLVGIVVETGIGAAKAALEEYEDGLAGDFATAGTIDFTQGNGSDTAQGEHCIALYYGRLGAGAALAADPASLLTPADLVALGLADQPAFYMEMMVTVGPNEDGKRKVEIRPAYLQYAASIARYRGAGAKTVVVTLKLKGDAPAPAKKGDAEAKQVEYKFDLGRIPIGASIKDADGDKALQGLAVARMIAMKGGVSLLAHVADSEDPSIAFTAFKTAFDDNSDDLSSALKDLLNPEKED